MIRKTVLITVLSVCIFIGASAQETVPNEETALLQEQLTKLETIVSKLPRISGFVNMRYQYNGATDANSFDIRRARLDLRGDIGRKVDYRLQVDFAGSAKILDAYVNWRINDYIGVQAGQFKTPFSLENPYSPTNLETMDNSLVITHLAGYSDVAGISANGRDIGLAINGNFMRRDGFSIINYSFGVFNGSGINRSDDNTNKDFSGILTIKPIKHLSLAGHHYYGHAEKGDSKFLRRRSGGGVKYDDGRWLARSEYIRGKTGELYSEGVYGVVGYQFNTVFQAVLKYDYWQRDTDEKDTRWNYYTVGFNFNPVRYLKVQFNYSYRTSPGEKDYHYAGTQLIAMF